MLIRILCVLCLYGVAAMFLVLFFAVLCDAPEQFIDKVFKLGISLGCGLVSATIAEVCLKFLGDRR